MNRYLIDFITKQQNPDEDFEQFTTEMERKINALTRDQADQIMNPHKIEGMAGAVDYGYADAVSRLRTT